jgi:hypothetical protein
MKTVTKTGTKNNLKLESHCESGAGESRQYQMCLDSVNRPERAINVLLTARTPTVYSQP